MKAAMIALTLALPTLAQAQQPVPTPAAARAPAARPDLEHAALPSIGSWLSSEYTRLALAENPPSPGAFCHSVCVFVRADVLSRDEWKELARRAAETMTGGPPDARFEALRFTGWHVSQALALPSLRGCYPAVLAEAIRASMADPEPRIRMAAAGAAIGARELAPDPAALVPALLRLFDDPDTECRRAAVAAISWSPSDANGQLTGLGPHAAAVIAALLRASEDPDRMIPVHAYSALGRTGAAGRVAVPELIRRLSGSDSFARHLSMRTLQNLGPHAAPAVPALTRVLHDAYPTARSCAARALGAIGPAAWTAVPALIALLDDPDADVQWIAAKAMGDIGPAAVSALPRLRAAVQADPEAFSGTGGWALQRILGAP